MSEAATSTVPSTSDTSLVSFTIRVNKETIPSRIQVLSVDMTTAINHVSFVRILLYDGDPAKQDFEISGGPDLELGKILELSLGYNREDNAVFKGIITKHKIKVKRSGGSFLYLEARDQAFAMTLNRKSRYFKELSDADLFSEIATEYNLTVQTDLTGSVFPEIVQYQTTDWDFLISRSERLGHYCFIDKDNLVIKKTEPPSEDSLTLTYGLDIYDADLEMEARTQFETIMSSCWDASKQEIINSENTEVNVPEQGAPSGEDLSAIGKVSSYDLRHSGQLSQEDLDAWSSAQMKKSRYARIRGTLRIQGNISFGLGDTINLQGFGNRFNGSAFVSGIRHNLGDGDWVTTIQLGDSPEWHWEKYKITEAPGSGFNPCIKGLQIGVVTQLQEDPNGENRIKVRLPLINAEDEGTWCRVARPDAGENRGIIWLPEIGDEVVVSFLSEDPNQAVVLGMLHSSAKPSPLEAADENHIKGIVSRSDMRLLFDDDKVKFSITTPAGNTLILDDDNEKVTIEDQNKNVITMDSAGITVESPKDIVLKATGDVKIEGKNIDIAANLNFKAEGSAGSKVSSGGTTAISGSLVNIN